MTATTKISNDTSLRARTLEWGIFGFGLMSLALAVALTIFAPETPPQQNAQIEIETNRANL